MSNATDTAKLFEYMTFATQLAMEAGNIQLKWRPKAIETVQWKSDNSPVTKADLEVRDFVRSEINKHYPGHGIHSEEGDAIPGDPRWIIDEIDGTYPFCRGYADDFCFNVALQSGGAIVLGITYAPTKKLIYSAITGQGAFCNSEPIYGSTKEDVPGSVIYIGSGKKDRTSDLPFIAKARTAGMLHVATGCHGIMLANCAHGLIDAFLATYAEIEDVAAGVVLAREAGLVITNMQGHPWAPQDRFCFAAMPVMHTQLSQLFFE